MSKSEYWENISNNIWNELYPNDLSNEEMDKSCKHVEKIMKEKIFTKLKIDNGLGEQLWKFIDKHCLDMMFEYDERVIVLKDLKKLIKESNK